MAKMVKCKSCGQDIAKSAKVCPHCGAKQHQGAMVACVIIIVIAVFAVVFVLANTFNGDDSSGDPVTSGGVSTPSEQPENPDLQGGGSGNEQGGAENTEVLAYNKDGLEIYFLGFSEAPAPAIGYYINLRIENTSDIDHTVQVRDVSADGIMVPFSDAIFSGKVLSGKTLNDHIWISNTEQLGIKNIMSSVELKFAIYSGDDLTTPETSSTITLSE